MADTMQFDLVSPERMLVSGTAASILIPGAEGDMVAMPDHAPVITTLRPGILGGTALAGRRHGLALGSLGPVVVQPFHALAGARHGR